MRYRNNNGRIPVNTAITTARMRTAVTSEP